MPIDWFLSNLKPLKIYYFSSNQLNTATPHYFVLIWRGETALLLVCCTSDRNNKRREFAEDNEAYSTIVWISPDEQNGLAKDTFVDCNSVFEHSIEDFTKLYEEGKLIYKGELSVVHYAQIIQGLLDSSNIANDTKDLLRLLLDGLP